MSTSPLLSDTTNSAPRVRGQNRPRLGHRVDIVCSAGVFERFDEVDSDRARVLLRDPPRVAGWSAGQSPRTGSRYPMP